MPVFSIACVALLINECMCLIVCLSAEPLWGGCFQNFNELNPAVAHERGSRGVWGRRLESKKWQKRRRRKRTLLCVAFAAPSATNATNTASILAAGRVGGRPDHCEARREGEAEFEMATWAAVGRLNLLLGDMAFRQ